jgi:hypothetical protein
MYRLKLTFHMYQLEVGWWLSIDGMTRPYSAISRNRALGAGANTSFTILLLLPER